jgi:hypothetical protein
MDPRWPDKEWDAGLAGFVYITAKKYDAEWSGRTKGRKLTKKEIAECERVAKNEIETLEQWLNGDIWSYTVYRPDGESADSCCGFYGHEDAVKEAKERLDDAIEKEKQESKKIKEMMRV